MFSVPKGFECGLLSIDGLQNSDHFLIRTRIGFPLNNHGSPVVNSVTRTYDYRDLKSLHRDEFNFFFKARMY